MTKARHPLTFHRALTRVAGMIGWDGAAEECGVADRTVRNWSDPDADAEISLRDALRLDIAYQRAGGRGAPLFECYALRLETEGVPVHADADDLVSASASTAKEAGEAVSALIHASRRSASMADRRDARREAEEAIVALTKHITMLGDCR